jgi:ribosomal protein S18 acetylase RimI-like enzyme
VTPSAARRPAGIKLRRARASDLAALVVLEGEAFTSRRFRGHLISPASFRRFLHSATSALIVAQVSRQISGYVLVLYRSNSNFARMYSIGVDPQFRRRGLARLLSAAAERDAKRRGRSAMRLEVRADDRGAVRFYETSGYRHFGKRGGYYGGHVDALRFAKTFTKVLPSRS